MTMANEVTSLSEFEALILKLYDSNNASYIKSIQQQIQTYQFSPEGWQYADALLDSSNQTIRFFGASTFNVRLQQPGLDLDETQCSELLSKLLTWFARLATQGEGNLVMKKISSALTAAYILPHTQWQDIFKRLVFCLVAPEEIYDNQKSDVSVQENLAKLDLHRASAVLVFVRTFAEDIMNIDDTAKSDFVHSRVRGQVTDAISIMSWFLRALEGLPSALQQDTFDCLEVWTSYVSLRSADSQAFNGMISMAVRCLANDQTFSSAAKFFWEMFVSHYGFVKEIKSDFLALVDQPWASTYLLDLENLNNDIDNDSNAVMFGRLLFTFGQATVHDLIGESNNQTLQKISLITSILSCSRFNGLLAHDVTDFWEVYNTESEDGEWTTNQSEHAQSQWLTAIRNLHRSITLPSLDSDAMIDMDEDYLAFRANVASLVHDSYAIYGSPVLICVVDLILSSPNYPSVEAGMKLLSGISEFIPDTADVKKEEDASLSRFFSSDVFRDVTMPDSKAPLRIRKLTIKIVGEHHLYLGNHEALLLGAMEFLFGSMRVGVAQDECSRAIFRLCDSNRFVMASKLQQLLEISEIHFKSEASTTTSREYIVGANAAVISALPPDHGAVLAMDRLLSLIEERLGKALEESVSASPIAAESDSFEDAAEATLAQLTKVGLACQTPDDAPVDIDDDDSISGWTTAAGHAVQDKIVNMLEVILNNRRDNASLLLGACNVLKTGYPEHRPGPFVFKSQVTTDLLTSTPATNPMLYEAVETAAKFASSHVSEQSKQPAAVAALLAWICQLRMLFSSPRDDPEVAYSCIEFLSRCLPAYVDQIINLADQALANLLTFSFECLDAPDPLPKRAAARFWSSFITPVSDTVEDDQRTTRMKSIILDAGPRLVQSLVRNVLGDAARSDLDIICDPLKRLFTSPYTSYHVRSWLQDAISVSNVEVSPNNVQIGKQEKDRFVAQIIALRGGGRTNRVVREFWMACRGMGQAL